MLERQVLSSCIKVIKHLHCFFVVISKNEPALIIGSKLNPFFCDDENGSLGEQCTTEYMSTVSARVTVI